MASLNYYTQICIKKDGEYISYLPSIARPIYLNP